jgi:lipopolysaccharide biosynthesis glycosyltransferase
MNDRQERSCVLSTQYETSVNVDLDPVVVLAADEKFAMPLAVTVRSALDNLAPGRELRIYVLDGGVSLATKGRLERSWPKGRYQITWIKIDASALGLVPVSGHVNVVSYFRILIPRVLPSDVHRAIYLDSDLLICGDLTRLWSLQLAEHLCLAVQDCSAPYIDAAQAISNYRQCAAYVGCSQPIPNFRALGLDPAARYFNAGVLMIDLDAWREADVSTQLIECLAKNKRHVLWWDQYAMNVVLMGRWGSLDPRWNQGSHIYRYPSWEQSPYDRESFEQQQNDPYIVHFTTRHKPWRASCRHPLRPRFIECLERTDWANWRLSRLDLFLEAIKAQERRFRHGRRWLLGQARRYWQPLPERSTS